MSVGVKPDLSITEVSPEALRHGLNLLSAKQQTNVRDRCGRLLFSETNIRPYVATVVVEASRKNARFDCPRIVSFRPQRCANRRILAAGDLRRPKSFDTAGAVVRIEVPRLPRAIPVDEQHTGEIASIDRCDYAFGRWRRRLDETGVCHGNEHRVIVSSRYTPSRRIRAILETQFVTVVRRRKKSLRRQCSRGRPSCWTILPTALGRAGVRSQRHSVDRK